MQTRSFTLLELLLTVLAVAMLILIFVMSLPMGPSHGPAKRSTCANNLKQIYTAMYEYAGAHNGAFPSIYPGSSTFDIRSIGGQRISDIKRLRLINLGVGKDPTAPVGPGAAVQYYADGDDRGWESNLWLLIREDFAETDIFRCPSDPDNKRWHFDIQDSGAGIGPEYFINFPFAERSDPDATTMKSSLSYSFIQPWSKFTGGHSSAEMWGPESDPEVPIGADANNGNQPNRRDKRWPLSKRDLRKYVNSENHAGKGQTVLFGGGHAMFQRSPYAGVEGDNIYTAMPVGYTGKPSDTPGILSVRPRDQFGPKINKPDEWDTVLIPVRDADLAQWNRKP